MLVGDNNEAKVSSIACNKQYGRSMRVFLAPKIKWHKVEVFVPNVIG